MGTGTLFRVPGCSPGPWASSVSLCAPWVPGCSPDPRVFPGPLPEEGHAERKRGGLGCCLGSARRVQRTRSLLLTARGSPETSAPPQWTVPVNADAPLLTRLRVSLTSVPKALSARLPLTQGGSEAQAVVEGGEGTPWTSSRPTGCLLMLLRSSGKARPLLSRSPRGSFWRQRGRRKPGNVAEKKGEEREAAGQQDAET